MRLLVCGDRNWIDAEMIHEAIRLANIPSEGISVVIEGEARGADSLARAAAEALGIPVLKFPANWAEYHRAAGPIRNKQMLTEGRPTQVFAFHDDIENSKGTRDMVTIARKAGVPVTVFTHKPKQEEQ